VEVKPIKDSKVEYIYRINRVIDYVKSNLDKDLSLEKLANIGFFSKFYFHRIFKSICGESVNNFVNRTRIETSAFLLIHRPHSPITTIAYDTGFSSPASYARAFKKHFYMTPSQWRKTQSTKSKICIINSKIDQPNNNTCQGVHKVTVYIDSQIKKPRWRINMTNDKTLIVDVKTMPDIHIAYLRHHGKYNPQDKKLFQQLFSKLINWAAPRNLFTPPETSVMTVYSSGHPDITAPENLCVDACISIKKENSVSGEIGKRVIVGGQYAVITLIDATLDECSKAWDELFNSWLPESAYQPSNGAYYCRHLNDPEQHPDKLHHVEMFLPVKAL